MKKQLITLSFFLALVCAGNISAQISDIGTMLSGSTPDAEKLLQAYFKPYANAFGANLNGAWFNTAKVHKLGGFDLTFSVSASFVPKADKEFNVSQLGLSSGAKPDPTDNLSPTVAGKSEKGSSISYPALRDMKYNLPQGTGWGIIPSPMLQLGIGLVKGTDITVRYVPDLTISDFGKFGLWGVGLKHSLKQWIPAVKQMPFFNFSLFLGYNQMKTSANLTFEPGSYNNFFTEAPKDSTTLPFNNQKMEFTIKSFTASLLASFDLPVVTFYAGVGFATNNANLALKGDYPLPAVNTSGKIVITNGKKDPVNIKMDSSSGTKPRLTGGIKFKMGVITYHIDYTYANYSVLTTGLGLSFR